MFVIWSPLICHVTKPPRPHLITTTTGSYWIISTATFDHPPFENNNTFDYQYGHILVSIRSHLIINTVTFDYSYGHICLSLWSLFQLSKNQSDIPESRYQSDQSRRRDTRVIWMQSYDAPCIAPRGMAAHRSTSMTLMPCCVHWRHNARCIVWLSPYHSGTRRIIWLYPYRSGTAAIAQLSDHLADALPLHNFLTMAALCSD